MKLLASIFATISVVALLFFLGVEYYKSIRLRYRIHKSFYYYITALGCIMVFAGIKREMWELWVFGGLLLFVGIPHLHAYGVNNPARFAFKCPHCFFPVVIRDMEVVCPACGRKHVGNDSAIMRKCDCTYVMEGVKCPHCNKNILFT